MALDETITIESILDSTLSVRALHEMKSGLHDAIVPGVNGAAHFTGRSEPWFDPEDPLRRGVTFR